MKQEEFATKTPLIPREVLFGNPLQAIPRLAPNGQYFSCVTPRDGILNVWVKTIGVDDGHFVTADTNRGVQVYFWSEDSRRILYLQDTGGNENWRLFAVNLDGGDLHDYTPFEHVQVQIVRKHKHFPGEMLIAMNLDNQEIHDVYHLILNTGELRLIARNPGTVVRWWADADFQVRCGLAANTAGGWDVLIRDSNEHDWRVLLSWDMEDGNSSAPVGFSGDGKCLYLIDSREANAGRLVKMEIAGGAIEVLAQDPTYDVSDVLIHPDTFEIQAVAFQRSRLEWQVLDNTLVAEFETISRLSPGDFTIVDRTRADDLWLVGFTRADGPIRYYVYQRTSGEGTFLFEHKPDLNQYTLAQMEPISFTSRDALTINGYITSPPRLERDKLPMVVNVHGGPWHRDTWGYDPEAQWFANRGYICLQINFRGSLGYGKQFTNAGDKEWGRKMHYDLVDGIRWVIEQGWADPNRIAIYGGSYGGYASLVGATMTPDLFRCAVDIVGPCNLVTFMRSFPPYWRAMLEMAKRRIGDPDTEEEFLRSRSPLNYVDQLRIPMLIAQGANDPRVPQDEAEQIVAALQEKGIEHEYMLFDDEGHGFVKPENRILFYKTAETFLARHLGGRKEG